MIPYIHIDELHVGLLPIHPFGVLVALGVAVGIELAKRRGRALALPSAELDSFIGWMLVGGFIGGHVFDELFYHPAQVAQAPWSLLYLWNGLSSFGGFAGALIGVAWWRYYELTPVAVARPWFPAAWPARRASPLPILPYADVVLAVFPVAWVFGRLGCTVVHDHPGVSADTWLPLAVAYGAGPVERFGFFELRYGDVPRFDLGLLELLFAVIVSIAFAATWRRRLRLGWYAAALPTVYAPVRFGLDFLRLDDPDGGDLRYWSLTPAQWACIGLFVAALSLWSRVVRTGSEASDGTAARSRS